MVQIAYKKLKSSVYFDKTQLILRQKLVEWDDTDKIDEKLKELSDSLENRQFDKLFNEICKTISYNAMPKKLDEPKDSNSGILFNFSNDKVSVNEIQYFIDMDIRGHILGVLWLMLEGYKIDEQIYEHSYGNRIRKNLKNEFSKECTFSPYLFEPYFQQYESWRDKGLNQALEHLKSKQDVVIITMDFKRYFYSVDMNDYVERALCDDLINCSSDEETGNKWLRDNLTRFIFMVLKAYSAICPASNGNIILPIGFLPSNVLSNWYLKNFDKAVCDGWNPIYYGRYVDDILIIDKVEKNSALYSRSLSGELKKDDIISFMLIQCSKWSGISLDQPGELGVLQIDDDISNCDLSNDENNKIYRVNPRYYAAPYSGNNKILLQNNKVKIFYFKSGESDALITCFRDKIAINASEFRHMPEDDSFFDNDYSEIYDLSNEDSPNKFRGITDISLNKYELSKFLGKHLRIGGLVNEKREHKFIYDVKRIFNQRTTIQYYDMWERVIEVFVVNNEIKAAVDFIERTADTIENVIVSENCRDNINGSGQIRTDLFLFLNSAICRAFSLVWGPKVREALSENAAGKRSSIMQREYIDISYRLSYLRTRMTDKSVMPVFVDLILRNDFEHISGDVNLTCFQDVLKLNIDRIWEQDYKYYPYIVTMYDISMISGLEQMKLNVMYYENKSVFANIDKIVDIQNERFLDCNYKVEFSKNKSTQLVDAKRVILDPSQKNHLKETYFISVGNSKKSVLKIAVANVTVLHNDFESLAKGNPNRSYKRYKEVSEIVNAAIDQKADVLIMPECYIPYEWLPTVARTCAKRNLAIITGVEHIICDKKVYNLTAVILPYKNQEYDYNCAYIAFHLKNHISPSEKELINGHGFKEVQGRTYELYKWNDCYFPVYCCYELASIRDRAIFQSYADFLVAIEWNRDINYYSNIIESLSRDIHCYCIQVNSSEYGDSRISKPSKTEEKDVLRTKGGINSTILVGEIDIEKLRSFQQKDYNTQKNNHAFKSTPPEFDREIVLKKIKGEDLFEK